MERENILIVATIVCIVGVIFLFKEMNKAKNDVEKLKEFSTHLIQQVTTTPEPTSPKPEEIEEDKTEENEEK